MKNKKVKIISKGKVGILQEVYKAMSDDREIAIIQLEDDSLTKALIDDIEIIQEEPEEDKKTVVIDEERFSDIVAKKAVVASKGDYVMGLAFTLFGALLGQEIFGEKAEND